MKKIAVSVLSILLLTLLASSVWDVRPDGFFASTVFTISGIMFSIGLGLIVNFSTSGVRNRGYILRIRRNVMRVRNSFLLYFGLSTFSYIANQYLTAFEFSFTFGDGIKTCFSASIFFCLLIIYSSIYFVVNFIELQKLNNDIFDKVNAEITNK